MDKINYQATYMNCITGISIEKAAVPMFFETDQDCIKTALGSVGLTPPERSRIVRIKNTLHIDEVEISEAYGEEFPGGKIWKSWRAPNPWLLTAGGTSPPRRPRRP